MKNHNTLVAVCLLALLFTNAFGQTNPYPFEVRKFGQGEQAIIFIPGFASSGDVWNETVAKFGAHLILSHQIIIAVCYVELCCF
jgi:hypothetical protein